MLEREKNKLAAEMAAIASKISLIVNYKFDKSQDISDYNVSLSTVITLVNLVVACAGVAYHSHLRSGTKQDVENFIASVKRETAMESEVRADIKELMRAVTEMKNIFAVIPRSFTNVTETSKSFSDADIQTDFVKASTISFVASDEGCEVSHFGVAAYISSLLGMHNAPTVCFAGIIIIFKCISLMS